MAGYLTIAEVYQMQYLLIEMFGGLHGVRDRGAVEAAVFRPQTGYYNSNEEASALMESLDNNHGFLDGNKRIAFTATDVFLRRNGFWIEVDTQEECGLYRWLNESGHAPLSPDSRLAPPAH